METSLERVIPETHAVVNVTFGGQNGELVDPVAYDSSDEQIKRFVAEVLATGEVRGITATAEANLNDFKVDRYPPTEARRHNLIMVRPKTPFGVR